MTTPTPAAFDSEDLARRADAVRALARHLLRDGADADDAAQEAWLVAMQRSPRADVPFAWWMRGVVRNVAMHLRRGAATRQRHESASLPPRATETPDTAVERTETHQRLVAAVLALDEPYRTTLILRYFEDRSAAEIARTAGVPAATVRSRIKRGLELLRSRLDDEERGDRRRWAVLLVPLLSSGRARPIGHGVASAAVAAALVAAIAVVAALGPWRIGGQGGPHATDASGHGTMEPASGRANRGAAPRARPPEATDGADAAATDETAAAPVAADSTAASPAPGTGLEIEVVDVDGKRLREGTVGFDRNDHIRSAHAMQRARALWDRLDDCPLADANPLSLLGVPEELDGLEASVIARVPGLPPSERAVFTFHAGEVAKLRLLIAPPRSAQVHVIDRANDLPVADAKVVSTTELSRRGIEPRSVRGTPGPGSAVTAADGVCLLAGLGRGNHELEVDAPGFVRMRAEWSDEDVVVRLERAIAAGRVTVHVIGPDGTPLAGIHVSHWSSDAVVATDRSGDAVFDGLPSGFGSFLVDLREWGAAEERFGRSAAGAVHNASATLEPGRPAELTIGLLPGVCVLHGRVVREDGTPVSGAVIEGAVGWKLFEAASDADGTFHVENLPAGSTYVWIGIGGTTWSVPELDLVQGRTAEPVWTIGDTTVRGRVVRDGRPVAGADVWMHNDDWRRAADGAAKTKTGKDGSFTIAGARTGTWRVSARGDEAGAELHGLTVPTTADVILEQVAYGRIAVRFAPGDRERLRKAGFSVRSEAGVCWASTEREIAGADTGVAATSILPGTYDVVVTLDGRTRSFPVEVTSGATSTVEVTAP